jgi:hypothetical protein
VDIGGLGGLEARKRPKQGCFEGGLDPPKGVIMRALFGPYVARTPCLSNAMSRIPVQKRVKIGSKQGLYGSIWPVLTLF